MSYPYQNNQYLQNLMMPQQRQPYNVTEVNGKNGVDAFWMPPNSSDLLLDTTAPIVWFVKTDGAGYKTCKPWKIVPDETEEEKQFKTLEERISKLEETINAKSNIKSTTKRNESE